MHRLYKALLFVPVPIDSSIIGTKTSLTKTETAQFVNPQTISNKTTLSGLEAYGRFDASTIQSTTTPITTFEQKQHLYTESSTIANKTTPITTIERAAFVNILTIPTKTSLFSNEPERVTFTTRTYVFSSETGTATTDIINTTNYDNIALSSTVTYDPSYTSEGDSSANDTYDGDLI